MILCRTSNGTYKKLANLQSKGRNIKVLTREGITIFENCYTKEVINNIEYELNTVGENILDYTIWGNSIKLPNYNLFDACNIYGNFSYPDSKNTFYANSSQFHYIKNYVTPDMIGKTFTFSTYIKTDNNINVFVRANINGKNINGNYINSTETYELSFVTFTPTSEKDFYYITYNSGVGEVFIRDIKLEIGSIVTDFTEYNVTHTVNDVTETLYLGNPINNKYIIPIIISDGKEIISFPIYLDNPLKKGEYINFKNRKIMPSNVNIELPTLPTYKGTTNIRIDTEIEPENFYIKYKSNVK